MCAFRRIPGKFTLPVQIGYHRPVVNVQPLPTLCPKKYRRWHVTLNPPPVLRENPSVLTLIQLDSKMDNMTGDLPILLTGILGLGRILIMSKDILKVFMITILTVILIWCSNVMTVAEIVSTSTSESLYLWFLIDKCAWGLQPKLSCELGMYYPSKNLMGKCEETNNFKLQGGIQ